MLCFACFIAVASTEHGTSTVEPEKIPIEIKFKSGLTYAEKLLLKKHRRADLKPLSPRLPDAISTSPRSEELGDEGKLMTELSVRIDQYMCL